jgi:hypothetical protein
MIMENFRDEGLAFVISKSLAKTIQNLHVSPLHWAPKQGKPKGRPIGDCSDGGSCIGNEPLNSVYTKEQSDLLWGLIEHPTIEEVVVMILQYAEGHPGVSWNDIVLVKADLRGAFTLLNYDPAAARSIAMEMTNDQAMIFHCGVFGWTGTPAAFQVVSRALSFELNRKLAGKSKIYSDDIIVVTERKCVPAEQSVIMAVCEGIMGPGAIEKTKSVTGRVLDFIGYTIDLERSLLYVAEYSAMKTLWGFMSVKVEEVVTVKQMQRLSSWGQRFSVVNIYMRPFVSVLYSEYAGRSQHVSFTLSPRAVRVIRLFRVLICLILTDPVRFSRPLRSFVPGKARILIEFDASLTGVGLLYYRLEEGVEFLVGGGSVISRF